MLNFKKAAKNLLVAGAVATSSVACNDLFGPDKAPNSQSTELGNKPNNSGGILVEVVTTNGLHAIAITDSVNRDKANGTVAFENKCVQEKGRDTTLVMTMPANSVVTSEFPKREAGGSFFKRGFSCADPYNIGG